MISSGITYGVYGTGARPVITGADVITTGWTSAGTSVWATTLATQPSLVWFNGVRGVQVDTPSAVAGLNEWTYSAGKLYVYSTTSPGSANIEASQRGVAVTVDGFGSETFESIDFKAGNSLSVYIGSSASGTQTFDDVVWEDSPTEGLMALSGSVQITNSIGQNNFCGLGIYGGGGVTLSGSLLSGNSDSAMVIAGTTGPSAIQSSTITGNATQSNVTYIIANWSGQPLVATNSILLSNPFLPAIWNFAGLTDDGTNVYKSPAFTTRAAPLIVVPYVDDYINLSVAQAVTSAAASYGFHISYALNTRLVTPTDWTAIAALHAAGHDIVAHTRTHSDLANLSVLSVQYTGPAAFATLRIDVPTNKIQTFLNGSSTPDLNLTLSDYFAAIDFCTFLSAQSGYSCSIPQAQQSWFDPINFADISNVDIKTAPYIIQADSTRYYTYEIQGAKADIVANIPGYTPLTFATPYSSSTEGVESLIQGAGFELSRNGLPDIMPVDSVLISHLDIFNIGAQLASNFDFADPDQSVAALVEGLGASGGIFSFYAHGYDEFTLAQWNIYFAQLKAIGATVMTATEAASYIRSHGSLVSDGTNRFWNVPVPFAPNYTPTGTSPSQGAHLSH
jgi:hypothetical protein